MLIFSDASATTAQPRNFLFTRKTQLSGNDVQLRRQQQLVHERNRRPNQRNKLQPDGALLHHENTKQAVHEYRGEASAKKKFNAPLQRCDQPIRKVLCSVRRQTPALQLHREEDDQPQAFKVLPSAEPAERVQPRASPDEKRQAARQLELPQRKELRGKIKQGSERFRREAREEGLPEQLPRAALADDLPLRRVQDQLDHGVEQAARVQVQPAVRQQGAARLPGAAAVEAGAAGGPHQRLHHQQVQPAAGEGLGGGDQRDIQDLAAKSPPEKLLRAGVLCVLHVGAEPAGKVRRERDNHHAGHRPDGQGESRFGVQSLEL